MQFDGITKLHRKSGFGLHQLRNRYSRHTGAQDRVVRLRIQNSVHIERGRLHLCLADHHMHLASMMCLVIKEM
jgi:hypothetical protein